MLVVYVLLALVFSFLCSVAEAVLLSITPSYIAGLKEKNPKQATLISIPNRYMHSPVEMISLKDLDNIIKLIVEFLAKHPAKKDYRP